MTTNTRNIPRPLIVGVGASADGLDALQTFLRDVPSGNGIAFVIVVHVDPNETSSLLQMLTSSTSLRVVEAVDGMPVEADGIYATPARNFIAFENGVLRMIPAVRAKQQRVLIDRFFQSLAMDQRDRAVGVILFGTGSDGSLGLKAVADAGGLTMVQAPLAATLDSMSQGASKSMAADHVLPPDRLATELLAYARHVAQTATPQREADLFKEVAEALPEVCEILVRVTGHNFKHYKASTLSRRMLRRIQVLRVASMLEYVEQLRSDEAEAHRLFRELLINVTAFFRDPEAFEALDADVLRALFTDRAPSDPVRVWVPGCATGEEAYTVAMLLRERMDGLAHPPEVQVFATDIDDAALARARQGSYPIAIADEVSPARLQRFFIKHGQQYHVVKELRDLILFSAHNLINDPPFSKLDLISCRNLLIYLGPHLQTKLIPLFHYALRPGGHLFLGPSENLSAHRELFRPVDAKCRISQRLPTAIRSIPVVSGRSVPPVSTRAANAPAPSEADIYLVMQRIVLDEFSPKAVVVNEDGQVVAASGNLEKYLTVTAGAFHNSITRLVREGLRVGVRAALAEAASSRRKVVHEGMNVRTEAGIQRMMVTVQPMPQLGEHSGLFMVVFHDVGAPRAQDAVPNTQPREEGAAIIEQLERELARTREDLEKTVQDLEAANEELKSSNEELLAMNEELTSANEELETSKEEVQSANNALASSNADLENLFAGTRVATLFLDDARNVRRVTPEASLIYNILPVDAGRPLDHFTHKAKVMPPLPDAAAVQAAEKPFEDEVEMQDGTWYLRRVHSYRTLEGVSEGIVVTFNEITERRRAEDALRLSEERYRTLATNMSQLAWSARADGYINWYNRRWYEYTGTTPEEMESWGWQSVHHPDEVPRVQSQWMASLATGEPLDMVFPLRGADGVFRPFLTRVNPVKDEEGRVTGWFGTSTDLSELRRVEDALKAADRRKDEFLATLAHELRNPLAPLQNGLQILVHTRDEDSKAQILEMMERQLAHLVRLIDDLLDVSRITSGKVALVKEHASLQAVCEIAIEASRPLIEASQHTLVLEFPQKPVWVHADVTRLSQVVSNLLNNAAKYTPAGGQISLSVSQHGEHAVVRVTDNGLGIPEDMHSEVFQMFAQVNRTLDRAQGGLGIGLALVKSLVDMHGGSITLHSAGQDRGSTFTVWVPATTLDRVPINPASLSNPPTAQRRTRVLVVDDNQDGAETLAMLLRRSGHVARAVFSGSAAVEAARQFAPELVLLDIGLPEVDGYEVARRLRQDPALGETTLVAVTGWGSEADRQKTREAGFDFHFTKPVKVADINHLIGTLPRRVTARRPL